MLAEDCAAMGLDFQQICCEANSAEAAADEEARQRRVDEHALVLASTRYMEKVTRWT
jgi:hypothetical protein